MEIDGTEYTWTRIKLPEGLEPVTLDELESNFEGFADMVNVVVWGGLMLVKNKKNVK